MLRLAMRMASSDTFPDDSSRPGVLLLLGIPTIDDQRTTISQSRPARNIHIYRPIASQTDSPPTIHSNNQSYRHTADRRISHSDSQRRRFGPGLWGTKKSYHLRILKFSIEIFK